VFFPILHISSGFKLKTTYCGNGNGTEQSQKLSFIDGASCGGTKVSVFFVAHFLSNVTVKVRIDCSVRRNKFMVNNPLHVEKTSMLFVELWTCRTFFPLGDCGLFHCDDCCFVSGS
jgi:hypothetical protein